ncbi:hypothetical protein MTR72_04880 [Bradyrhizobium sp. ISRA442]|uniref:hypothetical protein n=1 Tax=Bradyrhizobium sp. ISRA442 TaxID=2866197 RepID=UPI00311AD8C4
MAIDFNHTILAARDSKASADFLAEVLGLPAPRRWGPFHMVTTDNDANLDYMESKGEFARQHYAFRSAMPSSTRSSIGFASGSSPTGLIPRSEIRARSTITTADAASISKS